MTSRELFNSIMHTLGNQSLQLGAMAEQQNKIENRVEALRPQSYVPMIGRPIQGVDYARTCNVAEYVDKKVKDYNNNVGPNVPRYLEFAPDRTHDDLNRSALAVIGGIMVRILGDDYGGEKTWEKLYRKKPKACENILEEARLRPELAVFAQVDGQWCLRELAKNKLKSILRSIRPQRSATNEPELGETNVPNPHSDQVEAVQASDVNGTGSEVTARIDTEPGHMHLNNDGNNRDHLGNQTAVARVEEEIQANDTAPSPRSTRNDIATAGNSAATGFQHEQGESTPRNSGVRVSRNNRGRVRRAPRSGLSSRNVRQRNST